jgi:hypothetical protein
MLTMDLLNRFISMSEELCGAPAYYLRGTGYAQTYFETVVGIVGFEVLERLLDSYDKLPTCCEQDREATLRAEVLSHDEFGPIARNITKLWYLATWFQLPHQWHRQFGLHFHNRNFVPATYAYPESLLGPAVGAHPAGAKPTGHQSWVLPPEHLPFAAPRAPAACSRTKTECSRAE